MAIQLCPVDTANVHPRNILGSSSSFDRERLSPFGSLSSRCWETVVYITLSSGPGQPGGQPCQKGDAFQHSQNSARRSITPLCQNRGPASGGGRTLGALRPGLPAGAGPPRRSSPRPTGWCRTSSPLFAPAYRLVQDLLAAKRDLALPRQLRKLDSYDFLLLDDLGYLPQGAEESEVFFTLIAERYERRSLGITSNLVFSQWEHIFANPMATAAAIDRVVHHSVILEFDVPSYRTGVAQQRGQEREVNRQK